VAAFPRLTEAHREVLLLCLVEGLDSEAAGRVLDCRPEAVRKRLSRARAELARLAGFPHEVKP
jgi:RNA polymerase sigma-70 factor (ECF subfamily)